MLLLALFGCTVTSTSEDVLWSGYVYAKQQNGDLLQLQTGTLTMLDLMGEELIPGEQPYDTSPSYWTFTVPKEEQGLDIAIRIEAEGHDTMLWRGQTPNARSVWLGGTLYTHTKAYNQYFFSAVSNTEVLPLADGEVVHLYGQPFLPTAWANAEISITDGNGETQIVETFSYDEAGIFSSEISEKIDFFTAFNIAPGLVTLHIKLPDGKEISTDYPTEGGDLISAINFTL